MEQANKTATTPRKTKSKSKVVVRSNRSMKKEKLISKYQKRIRDRVHGPETKSLLKELSSVVSDEDVSMAKDGMIYKWKQLPQVYI